MGVSATHVVEVDNVLNHEGGDSSRKAFSQTLADVASGQLRFDHVACASCGKGGDIGPRRIVTFDTREAVMASDAGTAEATRHSKTKIRITWGA